MSPTGITSSVSEMIDQEIECLDGSLDYLEIAERIAPDLNEADREHYLILGLRDLVAARVAAMRPPTGPRGGVTKSERWAQVQDWWVPLRGEVTERTVAQLRSYCGYGDAAAQRRRKGVQSNWNAEARKRLHVIAECCMKQRSSPYRPVYDAAREKYELEEIPDLRKHNRALRAIAKSFLKNLWIEARRVHADDELHLIHDPPESSDLGDQTEPGTHSRRVAKSLQVLA